MWHLLVDMLLAHLTSQLQSILVFIFTPQAQERLD
jgi:hypothetical protein